jgi:pimeloyl-ACP methyl ester carboxylesterase
VTGASRQAVVQTDILRTGDLAFETDMIGNGERLALLLHGFPESKRSWRSQLVHLASLGYTAWAPNMRGYGRSSRPAGIAAYHVDRLVEDVGALMDLASQSGRRPVTLIAHDWGGIVAWFFALRRVRPLDALVVMNLPHPRRIVESLRSLPQLRRFWYIFFFQIPLLPEWIMSRGHGGAVRRVIEKTARHPERFSEGFLDELCRNAAEPGAMEAMIAYYRALFRDRALRLEALASPRLDIRTLLVWGEDDLGPTRGARPREQRSFGMARPMTIPALPASDRITGHARAYGNDSLAFFEQCEALGPIVRARVLHRRFFVVTGPDLLEQVLVKRAASFTKPLFLQQLKLIFGDGLLTSNGDLWRHRRRLLQPVFHRSKIAGYMASVSHNVAAMLADWRDGETRNVHRDFIEVCVKNLTEALLGVVVD